MSLADREPVSPFGGEYGRNVGEQSCADALRVNIVCAREFSEGFNLLRFGQSPPATSAIANSGRQLYRHILD